MALFSCIDIQEQYPGDINLEDIPWVEDQTPLQVNLFTSEGQPESQVKPGTAYLLVLESNTPVSLKFRTIDGFEPTGATEKVLSFSERTSIPIKTHDNMSGKVYFSVIPILKSGKELVRERPQGFLLPEN